MANYLAQKAPPDRHQASSASTAPTRPPARRSTATTSTAPACCTRVILRCPHAHAKIKSIDTAAAEKMPGVKAVHVIVKAGERAVTTPATRSSPSPPTPRSTPTTPSAPSRSSTSVLALPRQGGGRPQEGPEDGAAGRPQEGAQQRPRRRARPRATTSTTASRRPTSSSRASYGVPTICHQCLESHGLVAEWDKDGGLTVWASTQAVAGTAPGAGRALHEIPASARSSASRTTWAAASAASSAPTSRASSPPSWPARPRRPVKLMLDRAEEVTVGGNRPSAYGKVKIAGTKDGTITAYEVDCYGTPGVGSGGHDVGPLPYVYPHSRVQAASTRSSGSTPAAQRAMRAPGHPQNCFLTDCAARRPGGQARHRPAAGAAARTCRRTTPTPSRTAPLSFDALRNTIYTKEIEIAAELSDWKKKWHPPGRAARAPIKHGIGMALHTWGGQASPQPNECTVIIAATAR